MRLGGAVVGKNPLVRRDVAHGAQVVAAIELADLPLVERPPSAHENLHVPLGPRAPVREAPAVAVVDPDVVRDDAAAARGPRAVVEVRLLAVAAAEDLVEDAERFDQVALHEQAEADDRHGVGVACRARPADAPPEGEDVLTLGEPHGEVHGAVREGRREADPGVPLATRDHSLERPLGEQGVAVQEADPRSVRVEEPAVRRPHEAEVLRVLEEDEVPLGSQPLGRRGVARVVHDDDARPGRCEPLHGREAGARRAQGVVDRDHEVAADLAGRRRHRLRRSLSFHHGEKSLQTRER